MNSVERIKAICKERKIAISKLERDLGFANGYIGQLRKGVLPDDRLLQVSEYLNLSVEYLMTGEQKEKPAISEDDRLNAEFIELFSKLSDAEKTMMLSQLKGLVSGR
jgi:transcriptional regulator with XRE-family HTH domain